MIPTHRVTLQHLRRVFNESIKRHHRRLGMVSQRHLDISQRIQVNLRRIQQGNILTNNTHFLQTLHSTPARRCGQIHLIGQILIGNTRVLLQNSDNRLVVTIQQDPTSSADLSEISFPIIYQTRMITQYLTSKC